MNAFSTSLAQFTDAASDAVARAIAGLQRDAARDRELREAEHRARLAELETRIASAALVERELRDRLVTLKDGRDGATGEQGTQGAAGPTGVAGARGLQGETGLPGPAGECGAPGSPGPPGLPGERGLPGEAGPAGERGIQGEAGLTGPIGPAGLPGERGPAGADGQLGAPGPQGPAGEIGPAGATGLTGDRGLQGEAGPPGERGAAGERGPEGPPGKLPAVKAWADRVHYEAEVVTFDGSVYQACRDTGRSPPHDDWICLASAGRDGADGRSFVVHGTWNETAEYRAMDVVALGGASFVARRDAPGPCPGEGWQLIASQGKQGKPGDRGAAGPKGDRGDPGPAVATVAVDAEGVLTLVNTDGSVVNCDFYPVLSRLGAR